MLVISHLKRESLTFLCSWPPDYAVLSFLFIAAEMTPAPDIVSGQDQLQSRTIDWLRFLMAVAVVVLHTGIGGVDSPYPTYSTLCILLPRGICGLAVSCFFFISGFLFYSGLEKWNKTVWLEKMKRRIHSLLIPYVFWNLIAAGAIIAYGFLRARYGNGESRAIASSLREWGYWRIFWDCDKGMPLDYPLWFIRDLMMYVLATPIIYLLCKYLKIVGVVGMAALCFCFWYSHTGLFFFMTGAYFKINRFNLLAVFRNLRWPATALSIALLCMLPGFFRANPSTYRVIYDCFRIAGIVAVFSWVGRGFEAGVLRDHPFLKKSSFFIFAAHGILILDDFARFIMLHIVSGRGEFYYCCDLLFRPVIAVGICLFLFCLLNRLLPKTASVLTGSRS